MLPAQTAHQLFSISSQLQETGDARKLAVTRRRTSVYARSRTAGASTLSSMAHPSARAKPVSQAKRSKTSRLASADSARRDAPPRCAGRHQVYSSQIAHIQSSSARRSSGRSQSQDARASVVKRLRRSKYFSSYCRRFPQESKRLKRVQGRTGISRSRIRPASARMNCRKGDSSELCRISALLFPSRNALKSAAPLNLFSPRRASRILFLFIIITVNTFNKKCSARLRGKRTSLPLTAESARFFHRRGAGGGKGRGQGSSASMKKILYRSGKFSAGICWKWTAPLPW